MKNMYETNASETERKFSFSQSLASVPGTIDRSLPSMDKRLDLYLDAHMSSIISEWGLVTRFTLEDLEHRLDAVSTEIGSLEQEKNVLERRTSALDMALRELENK